LSVRVSCSRAVVFIRVDAGPLLLTGAVLLLLRQGTAILQLDGGGCCQGPPRGEV
jgi:hypothetical protein